MPALRGKQQEPRKGLGCCETPVSAPLSELPQQSPAPGRLPPCPRCRLSALRAPPVHQSTAGKPLPPGLTAAGRHTGLWLSTFPPSHCNAQGLVCTQSKRNPYLAVLSCLPSTTSTPESSTPACQGLPARRRMTRAGSAPSRVATQSWYNASTIRTALAFPVEKACKCGLAGGEASLLRAP